MIKAAIFDMDGLLIDSEPFWQQAEREVFESVGVTLSPELCQQTASMTTQDVTNFWFARSPWQHVSKEAVENKVINAVTKQISLFGRAMPGVYDVLTMLRNLDIKIGLATNSPLPIVPVVLEKLGISSFFSAISSADEVILGKPAPDVYKLTLAKLQASAGHTIAFEDSVSGMKAAIAAGIKPVVVPAPQDIDNRELRQAVLTLTSLTEFKETQLSLLSI